jgi:hypothetical protein
MRLRKQKVKAESEVEMEVEVEAEAEARGRRELWGLAGSCLTRVTQPLKKLYKNYFTGEL